jgi:plasmid stabilization system protein ParE
VSSRDAEDRVDILRVVHGARDIAAMLDEGGGDLG